MCAQWGGGGICVYDCTSTDVYFTVYIYHIYIKSYPFPELLFYWRVMCCAEVTVLVRVQVQVYFSGIIWVVASKESWQRNNNGVYIEAFKSFLTGIIYDRGEFLCFHIVMDCPGGGEGCWTYVLASEGASRDHNYTLIPNLSSIKKYKYLGLVSSERKLRCFLYESVN